VQLTSLIHFAPPACGPLHRNRVEEVEIDVIE
jgi:hypothetical protein